MSNIITPLDMWRPENSFSSLKREFMKMDPVSFAETFLQIDGKPLKLTNNGWDFIADVYRYITTVAMSNQGKPIVIVKGRQVGATVMASALELFMVSSGVFGTGGVPPVRVTHAFPHLDMMHGFSKDKLEKMIMESTPVPDFEDKRKPGQVKPYVQSQKNSRREATDSLYYKQFKQGNVLWCESIGNEGTRVLGRTFDVCFFDEIQDMSEVAIAKTTKCLTHAQHGVQPGGVQVYFGTPRQKGTFFHSLWENSDQRRYYLRCKQCGRYFLLYTPGSDIWEKEIWLYENIVKCPNCGCEQDKVQAVINGKWMVTPGREDSDYVGFHFNQLFIPTFTKEVILKEKPENNPRNSELIFNNEILGEFHSGAGMPITREEIYQYCRDPNRSMSKTIPVGTKRTYMGLDWGGKPDIDGVKRGQSYSCGVVLSVEGDRLDIEYAQKLKRIDMEGKMSFVDNMFRRYGLHSAFGDEGFANDISLELKSVYGDKYKSVRSVGMVNGGIKYNSDLLEVVMDSDKIIGEVFELMKRGVFRFPWASYEAISWLVAHCCSMESKIVVRQGQPHTHYVKGRIQNDGFMALLYAYIAYKFDKTRGFKSSLALSSKSSFPMPKIAHLPKIL